MNEKPIERLNYFNGQRLQAADFKLEQDYHVRVRRWLNRSLYTSGIADGLTVIAETGAPRVRVGPGLALDANGREIILVDEQELTVPGSADANNRPIALYLTIRYAEDLTAQVTDSCVPVGKSKNKAAWGGPSRVLADPIFDWSVDLPLDSSGKVLLAYVQLGPGCKAVNNLDTSVRRYVGAASAAKVKQYALEGVRDVNEDNGARIYFHIRGRQPNSVTLYLRAELLPSLYYTEMGHHTHPIHVSVNDLKIPAHTHGGNPGTTGPGGKHTPTVTSVIANADADVWNGVLGVVTAAAAAASAASLALDPSADAFLGAMGVADIAEFVANGIDPSKGKMSLTVSPSEFTSMNNKELTGAQLVNMRVSLQQVDDHKHPIDLYPADGSDQKFPLSGSGTSDAAGASDKGSLSYGARTADPLTYVNTLQISIDDVPCTAPIVTQIASNRPDENWTALGDGSDQHPLVVRGSGAIRIDYIPGIVLGEDEHHIDFTVSGDGNGGRIHFNLYVE